MKKQLLLLALFTFTLQAEKIQMTSDQEKNWDIKTEAPKYSEKFPLGEFIAQVVTPPSLLHTISLPFEANVKRLNVAKYQEVTKGHVLAEVTGTKWIEIQQKAIADAIEFRHHTHLTERKNMLCKEDIIPQKECVAANAELETDKIKVAASKALLKSYGASDETIAKLFKELTLSQTIKIKSIVGGSVVELHATPGKSTNPDDALFIIQQKGPLWLETDIEAERTTKLKEGQKVQITLANQTFETTILQLSPVINPENQTRQVRFLVPHDINIVSGLRSTAKIVLFGKSLKVKKTSIIKEGDTQIVFIKIKDGFIAVPVEILAEDNRYYYIKPSPRLENKIAVNSIAILKNMLGENNE
jgi:cobalt-zinc-cadmium efflux system membrane fusion protein